MASTLVQFLPVASLRRTTFSQYSQGSVASFATQFNIDWAGSLPVGGVAVAIAAKAGAATVAEIVVAPGISFEMNPLDYVSCVNGVWTVLPPSAMGRTVADGATNSNGVVTSATIAFVSQDVGAVIATPNLPSGTTILSLNSGTSVNVSATATATATSQNLTITRTTSQYTPVVQV